MRLASGIQSLAGSSWASRRYVMGATFLAATGAAAGFQASLTVSCPISVTKGLEVGNFGGTANNRVLSLINYISEHLM